MKFDTVTLEEANIVRKKEWFATVAIDAQGQEYLDGPWKIEHVQNRTVVAWHPHQLCRHLFSADDQVVPLDIKTVWTDTDTGCTITS